MAQKPSPMLYVRIAISLAAAGTVLILVFAWFGQTRLPQGLQPNIYYLILLIWGCVCAIILFGVVRGVARITHSSVGTSVQLGGPVAVAVLVVWGGVKAGAAQDERSIVVRPFAVDSNTAVITQGTVILESGDVRYSPEVLTDRGEARFGGLAAGRVVDSVRVLVRSPGYVERWVVLAVRRGVVDVPMMPIPPVILVRGRLSPAPPRGSRAMIELDGNRGNAMLDSSGQFTLAARGKRGETVGIRVSVDGRVVVDRFVLLDTAMMLEAAPPLKARSGQR